MLNSLSWSELAGFLDRRREKNLQTLIKANILITRTFLAFEMSRVMFLQELEGEFLDSENQEKFF